MSEKLAAALDEGECVIRLKFEGDDIMFRVLHLPHEPITDNDYRLASLAKGMVSIVLEDAQSIVDRGQREFEIEEAMEGNTERVIN